MQYATKKQASSSVSDVLHQTVDAHNFLSARGASLNLECVFKSAHDEIMVQLSDGSMRRAILYIGDASRWPKNWRWPRFHIFHCKTMLNMKNKIYKYKASGNGRSLFVVNRGGHANIQRLEICRKCLKMYNKTFRRKKTAHTFSVQNYLDSK